MISGLKSSSRRRTDQGKLHALYKYTVVNIGATVEVEMAELEKTPIDGLCGKSDEDQLGFSYEVLDRYIREGICEDEAIKNKIDKMSKLNQHKLLPMPCFEFAR